MGNEVGDTAVVAEVEPAATPGDAEEGSRWNMGIPSSAGPSQVLAPEGPPPTAVSSDATSWFGAETQLLRSSCGLEW